jgi:hypothetical protein
MFGVLATACGAAPAVAPSQSPAVASSPTAAVTSSPAPTASATTAPTTSGRPGLISRRSGDPPSPLGIRTEADATPIRTVPSFGFVSDGPRLSYWTENAGAAELHILEIGSGNDRIVATFPDRRGGGIAWSTDGTGLLASVDESRDPRFLIARILMAVDIATGSSREVYRGIGPSGASVIPLVWRRSPEIFAAYETGPGGYHFGYTVIRPGQAPVRTEPDGQVSNMIVSSDGTIVSGFWLGDRVLKVWPVDDFSMKTEFRLTEPDHVASAATWWPGRRELAFIAAERLADGALRNVRIERWDPASGAHNVLKRLGDGVAIAPWLIRADGSGYLIRNPTGAWEVTDLRTGATATIPQLPGETILQTVLLR